MKEVHQDFSPISRSLLTAIPNQMVFWRSTGPRPRFPLSRKRDILMFVSPSHLLEVTPVYHQPIPLSPLTDLLTADLTSTQYNALFRLLAFYLKWLRNWRQTQLPSSCLEARVAGLPIPPRADSVDCDRRRVLRHLSLHGHSLEGCRRGTPPGYFGFRDLR